MSGSVVGSNAEVRARQLSPGGTARGGTGRQLPRASTESAGDDQQRQGDESARPRRHANAMVPPSRERLRFAGVPPLDWHLRNRVVVSILDLRVQNDYSFWTWAARDSLTLDGAVTSALNIFWKSGYGATTPAVPRRDSGWARGALQCLREQARALRASPASLRRRLRRRPLALVCRRGAGWPAHQGIPRAARCAGEREDVAPRLLRRRHRRGAGRHDPVATKIVRAPSSEWRASSRRPSWREKRGELDGALDPKAVASLLLAALIGITVLAKVDSSAARTMDCPGVRGFALGRAEPRRRGAWLYGQF